MITKEHLLDLIKNGPLILDGATGTNLMKRGMPAGACPEEFVYNNKDIIQKLQREFIEAGSKIIYAPTFTANRIKLKEYGLYDRMEDIVRTLVRYSKEAAGDDAYVALDISMTGQQVYPIGDLDFEELIDIYKEQISYALLEDVDLIVVETMMSLQECRAAVIAAKELCDLPIMVSLTYAEDGRTLFGTDPVTAVITLQNLGVDVVGLNCSTGPQSMLQLVADMVDVSDVPIMAKPNAGLPKLIDGETVYDMTPAEYALAMRDLVKAGAAVVGGCCGTTPDHIKAFAQTLKDIPVDPHIPEKKHLPILTSERAYKQINLNDELGIIGERINPTGKKKLQEELRAGSMKLVKEFALSQEEAGAIILDVNMGTNGINERDAMEEAIHEVSSTVDLPICIDTSFVDVMEAALRIYPGRALINSISAESEKMEQLLPIAKKYGAMFIALPVSDDGIPERMIDRKHNIESIIEHAEAVGLHKNDIVVDILVATIGADKCAAINCFETISYCYEKGLPTVCGLSNISFGLPNRVYVNSAFLSIAISKGLTLAIANPSQDVLMFSKFTSDMLMNKNKSNERFIEFASGVDLGASQASSSSTKKENVTQSVSEIEKGLSKEVLDQELYQAVVKGDKENIVNYVKYALAAGKKPSVLVEEYMIPAINVVGDYFDKKRYFLPQLIASANAMKEAMSFLEPLLLEDRSGEASKGTVVFATVEGDVHDIGKNLCVLMLKNYGYDVYDLGKDISADEIVDKAVEVNADVIGLSALMTTTMIKMEDTINLIKERNLDIKVIIGGACITPSYSDEIGADGYSKDAADCVKLVDTLVSGNK